MVSGDKCKKISVMMRRKLRSVVLESAISEQGLREKVRIKPERRRLELKEARNNEDVVEILSSLNLSLTVEVNN